MKVSELLEGLKDMAAAMDNDHASLDKLVTSIEAGVVIPLSKIWPLWSRRQQDNLLSHLEMSDWDVGPWVAAELLGLKNMNELGLLDRPQGTAMRTDAHDNQWNDMENSFEVEKEGTVWRVHYKIGTAIPPRKSKAVKVIMTSEAGMTWFCWKK